MTDQRRVTIHLTGQATVQFSADQLWPVHGDYSRFGVDLAAFALEVARRIHTDGWVGYTAREEEIVVIPLRSIMRIDFRQEK